MNLSKAAGASLDPKDKTFVLFDYTGNNPALPASWTIKHSMTGWAGGSVSVDTNNRRGILTGLVPQPADGVILLLR